MLLVGNGLMVTRDPKNPFFADGCVAIEGKTIAKVGTTAELRSQNPGARFIDAKGGVILPGMINAHMHFYSAFSRGIFTKDAPAQNFNEVLERLWWRLDKALTLNDVYYSTMVCLIDCIKNGTTTVLDHHASPNAVTGSLFAVAKACQEVGIRSSLCYEVSDRDGAAIMQEGIKENIDFILHAEKEGDDALKGMFGLHASMTLSNETLEKCAQAMSGCDAGYHVHVAEGPGDEPDSEKKYGKRIVQRFKDFDITGNKSIAVHCIHVNSEEMDILGETGTAVVHNPESNMGNAVGTTPVLEMMRRGILLGLGTDGYVSDMLQSYKMANVLHKHHNEHPNVAWGEIPTMLFENNIAIAGRCFQTPVGRLEAGYSGDVIISDYLPPTKLDDSNINGHLLFGAEGRSVVTTVSSGKVLMEDRKILGLDEREIYAKARELSVQVWERF